MGWVPVWGASSLGWVRGKQGWTTGLRIRSADLLDTSGVALVGLRDVADDLLRVLDVEVGRERRCGAWRMGSYMGYGTVLPGPFGVL